MKQLLPDKFKKWYHSSKVTEARIQLMKMLSKEGSTRIYHSTSETACSSKAGGKMSAYAFERWHINLNAILRGRQAPSKDMLGATPLIGHQHLCCHYIMNPKRRFDFNTWASAEAPHLVGAHWIMLSTDNQLLLIARMNPWANVMTEQLEPSASKYVIATAAASARVGDEQKGPGSALTGDEAHAEYCLI